MTGTVLVEEPHRFPDNLRKTLTDLLGPAKVVTCAAPAKVLPMPTSALTNVAAGPRVRLAGYWHDSLIEGPGRRTVVKLQGCPIRCIGCITPESWDPSLGSLVPAEMLADALLDPSYERDGVSILGGEPFAQPEELLALVRALRSRGSDHILAYSGYTHDRLRRIAEHQPAVGMVLDDIDVLIDGPYVEALADRAGPWTGSGNQRVIDMVATRWLGRLTLPEPI